MALLIYRFVDENKAEWLVKALLETIGNNKAITDGTVFYVDGTIWRAFDLQSIDNVCVPSFVLGIWHYIVMNVKDNLIEKLRMAGIHVPIFT